MAKQIDISDLPKLSIYRYENFFNIYNDNKSDVRFYNLLRNISVFPAKDSVVEEDYVLQYGDNWATISYKMYNTIDLWWLICAYNEIQNPIDIPPSGTLLKILKSEYVGYVLTELSKQIAK